MCSRNESTSARENKCIKACLAFLDKVQNIPAKARRLGQNHKNARLPNASKHLALEIEQVVCTLFENVSKPAI